MSGSNRTWGGGGKLPFSGKCFEKLIYSLNSAVHNYLAYTTHLCSQKWWWWWGGSHYVPMPVARISKAGGSLFGGKVDPKPKGGGLSFGEKVDLCTMEPLAQGGGLRTPPPPPPPKQTPPPPATGLGHHFRKVWGSCTVMHPSCYIALL